MNESVQKYYRYYVSDPDRRFLGEWTDVISQYSHVDEINSFGGDLKIQLGRGIRNTEVALDYLADEDGDLILDEDGEPIITEGSATINVGDGTDIAHGNRIDVYEHYGSVETILDEEGEEILDEDGEPILAETGALNGRPVFSGYISQYEVSEGPGTSGITVTCLPHAADLADMIFENYLWSFVQNVTGTTYGREITEQNGTDRYGIVQTFQAPASGQLLRIVTAYAFPADVHLFGIYTITIKVYTGNDPNGSRTLIHTGYLTTDWSPWSGQSVGVNLHVNDGPQMTSASWYHLEISVSPDRLGTGSAPASVIVTDSGYSGGTSYSVTGASTTYVEESTRDLYFIVDVLTSRETKATYTSWDLAAFVDQTVDLASARGARINANNSGTDYIEDPATTVPEMVFNVDTYKERLDTAVKAAPLGWYYRYDHGTRSIFFKPRHETPDHVLIIGTHVKSVDVVHDTENIVNTVYFTGGPYPTDTDPPLYKRYADAASVAKYGVKAKGITDGRIRNESSADIRGDYEVLSNKDPVYRTVVTVLDKKYDTGTIYAGDTVGFSASGTFIDTLVLQVIRKDVRKGLVNLTLGALPPNERRRLNDLKMAIERMEVENNESSPA